MVHADVISEKFADYFSNCFNGNNDDQIGPLKEEYLRKNYFGLPLSSDIVFGTELISKVIADLKRGKAADIHGLPSTGCLVIQFYPSSYHDYLN